MEQTSGRPRILVKALMVALLAVVLVAMGTGPAWADSPEVVRESLALFIEEGGADGVTDCDGDSVNDYTIDLEGKLIAKSWPDGRQEFHFNWDGRAWTSAGASVRIHHAFTVTVYPDGILTVTGLPFGMFGDPGGPIVMDAGLVRIDGGFFVAGPHQLLTDFAEDPNAATCDALGLTS